MFSTQSFCPNFLKKISNKPQKLVSESGESTVYFIEDGPKTYYLKHYFREKTFKHWLKSWFKNKPENEIDNLKLFQTLGIRAPKVLAFEIQKRLGQFQSAQILLEGLENTMSLADMAKAKHPLLQNRHWRLTICRNLALYTRMIHRVGFVHLDLKWRNVLALLEKETPQIFWIDCPSGYFVNPCFAKRAFIKDLACLDKVGKKTLSKTDRLRFFKWYQKIDKLSQTDKKMIGRILGFFQKD